MSPRTQPRQNAGLSNYWTLRRIGAAVMIRRLDLNMDRADLAARLGIPAATVEAIEHGNYDPRMILAPRLETALELAPGTLQRAGDQTAV